MWGVAFLCEKNIDPLMININIFLEFSKLELSNSVLISFVSSIEKKLFNFKILGEKNSLRIMCYIILTRTIAVVIFFFRLKYSCILRHNQLRKENIYVRKILLLSQILVYCMFLLIVLLLHHHVCLFF